MNYLFMDSLSFLGAAAVFLAVVPRALVRLVVAGALVVAVRLAVRLVALVVRRLVMLVAVL